MHCAHTYMYACTLEISSARRSVRKSLDSPPPRRNWHPSFALSSPAYHRAQRHGNGQTNAPHELARDAVPHVAAPPCQVRACAAALISCCG